MNPSHADPATAPALPAVPLRPSGVRVLITDGLWPDGATAFVQRLFVGCSRCFLLQVLDPWELAPTAAGALTLVDVETGGRAQVQLAARALQGYQERLGRLCDALRSCVLGHGGAYARVGAATLPAMCERDLLPNRIVEPA